MQAQEFLYDARALIDEYNEDGNVTSSEDADIKTIETNGLRFINMAVQEVFRDSKSFAEHVITNTKIPNLIGDEFNQVEFIGDEQYYPENGIVGAKAYFFTITDDATVRIEEYNGTSWDILETLTLTPTTRTDYKGLVTATDTSYPIRLVFGGATFYRHQNRCLYSYPFKATAIPDYKAWVRYEMPSNYGELDEIVAEYPTENYAIDADFKWEGFNVLAVRHDYEGSLKVIYNPRPTTISLATDEVVTYNPTAEQFIRFFVAAKIATTENPDLVNFFEQKANEMKFESMKTQPASEEPIIDVYTNNRRGGYYGYI